MKFVKLVAHWLARRNRTEASFLTWVGDSHHWEVTAERLDILRDADLIVRQEINRSGIYSTGKPLPFCCPSAVLWATSTYAYPIVLRLVSSEDGMTDWARVPYDLLETISNRIVNEVRGVNRVVYDITSASWNEWE